VSDASHALVPFEPSDLGQAMALARELASSALIASALRQRPQDVLVMVLTGRDLGLTPMQALRGIDIVEGKPRLSADLVAALVLRAPQCEYLEPVACDATRATYAAKRRGRPEQRLTYTIEEAQLAGLLDRGPASNWRRNPARMLDARCKYIIAKKLFPDVLFGVFDPDDVDELASAGAPGRAFIAPPPPPPPPLTRAELSPPSAPSAPPPAEDAELAAAPVPVERTIGDDDDEPGPSVASQTPPLEELLGLLEVAATRADGQRIVARAKAALGPEEIEQFRAAYGRWWRALPPEPASDPVSA